MMLPVRKTYLQPPQLNLASAGNLGTTQKVSLDRTWPIEEIILMVDCIGNGTALTLVGVDNLLGLVKNVNLSVNDGVQPRSVVDYSGIGLLERASLIGLNLDRATSHVVGVSTQATMPLSQTFRIAYRIPLVHPLVSEPLRSRCLLPVHLWPQDPVLTVTFESAANMYSGGAITTLNCTVILVRRVMPQALSDTIIKTGGFIPFDILESSYQTFGGAEVRIPIATPGSYADLCFRQYLGGSTVTRDVLDATTTVGAETRTRLESGGVVYSEWRWKYLQTINDYSRTLSDIPYNGIAATALASTPSVLAFLNPVIGGKPATNSRFQPASSTCLDFLTDGIGGGDPVDEFGSLLDCNLPARSGLKMELITTPAAVTTNASIIYFGGQRYFGDLSPWQVVK